MLEFVRCGGREEMRVVSVVVRGRVPGRVGIGDVLLDVAPAPTVRELIGAVVAVQLAGEGVAVWSDCSRLYLTDEEIAAMAVEGVVRVGVAGETSAGVGEVLPTVAAATVRAVEAFRRGVFVMFAGARQVGGIDETVPLRDGDRVVFLRLTALAGG
jgi:hypothetical protein